MNMKQFTDSKGNVVSVVENLTPQIEAETVVHGKEKADYIRLYLDGDRTTFSSGPNRPCVRIEFAADGKTVVKISLLNDPAGADFEWKR